MKLELRNVALGAVSRVTTSCRSNLRTAPRIGRPVEAAGSASPLAKRQAGAARHRACPTFCGAEPCIGWNAPCCEPSRQHGPSSDFGSADSEARSSLTIALTVAAILIVAWLLVTRTRDAAPRKKLSAVASSPWMLDHFCVSLGLVLREWPELREVRLDVEALAAFDDASIASLKAAIATAGSARVRFRIDGYSVNMACLALLQGIDARHFGRPRATSASAAPTLH